uniref:EF-hand domain family member D1 n=1 Tax=Equus caballus TaxID=9796 RepID=A0A9L0S982_HORSE
MASEELARKLQRRLQREEAEEGGPQPAPCAAAAPEPEPEPAARAPLASADAELSAKLSRRLDINEGAARPRRCKVFNPYTEFPEFSRRLIKDLENMFKLTIFERISLLVGCLRMIKGVHTARGSWETKHGGIGEEAGVQRSMVALGHGWLLLSARTRLQSSPAPHQSACRLHLWAGTRWYDAGRDGFIDLMELKLMMEKLGAPQTHLGLKSMIKEVDEDFDGKLSFREFLLIFHKAAAGELQEDSGLMALAKLSEINVALEGVKGAKDFFEAKVQALSSASKFEAELKAEQDERKQEEEKRRLRQAAFRELKAAFSA